MEKHDVPVFAVVCALVTAAAAVSCGGDDSKGSTGGPLPSAPSCEAADKGSTTIAKPTLRVTLKDPYSEAWLSSPAVADLDGDGKNEVIAARDENVVVWGADGAEKWRFKTGTGRIWASPVVADFDNDGKLEVAVASRDTVFLLDHNGDTKPGFPVTWEDELRSLAAADVDGDGALDLVAAPGHSGPTDVMIAWDATGNVLPGFPPNQAGVSGCEEDGKCYLAGCYDQNVALGDLDGDGKADVVVGHDDAYASFHHSTGEAFDANSMFSAKKTPGVRYLFDLASAKQGYADDEESALQAHFTNTAPAIADLDGDGVPEILLLGSVQNASQSDREKGVALWALHSDASRLKGWEKPFHAPDYLAGLWDYDGVNVVAATNQVTVADIDPGHPGPELIFAGFDGRIHAVTSDNKELWNITYTSDENVLTGGVVVADLSGDGIPEVVFNTYSRDEGKGSLFVLDGGGNIQHEIPLPHRGAMPVPTIADVDGDGALEIVVSLKDGDENGDAVQVYSVAGSADTCLLWPTGRGNLFRSAWVRSK
jgi:outer membrane protein assembly factor BamB